MASSPVTCDYKLCCQLTGHTSDVRGLAVTPDGSILSASRDKTTKVWKKHESNVEYADIQTLRGHSNFVSCVCFLNPCSSFKSGLILTGGNDKLICVFDPENWQLLNKLNGHSNTVCSLAASNNGEGAFLSASWDATACLWRNGLPEVTLSGHQAAVWCAIDLPESNIIVTGSADKTISLWTPSGQHHNTLTGHTDCVRGLAVLTSTDFLSCANDATIRRWCYTTGDCLFIYYGHSNFIYSVDVGPAGEFVSSAEDGTIRIWGDSEASGSTGCLQTITLPAPTIWSVAYLPNGDIVTGSSDGVIRVFSRDSTRVAGDVAMEVFNEEVQACTAAAKEEIGGIKLSDLPGREVLLQDGLKDGQTKLVREGRIVTCYQWVASAQKWEPMGEVMGASGGTQATSGKQLYNGKEYDYVFSVDVEDGKPPLKLPYNKSDDPWLAAQKFIDDNNLSQFFLDQVANFILENSKSSSVNTNTSGSDYVDPFTGGNRYIPGESSAGNSLSPGGPKVDFITTHTSTYFPQKTYVLFEQANLGAILDKLREFNNQLSSNQDCEAAESEVLEEVVKIAALDPGAPSMSMKHLSALENMLGWPLDKVHPALDVTRLAVRQAYVNQALCSPPKGDSLIIGLLQRTLEPSPNISAPVLTFALRLAVNMFSHRYGEELALQNWSFLLGSILALSPNPVARSEVAKDEEATQSLLRSSPVQVALSTLLLNFAVAFAGKDVKTELNEQRDKLLEVAIEVLTRLTEPEAQFRSLVSFGTLTSSYSSLPRCLKDQETQALIKNTINKLAQDSRQAKLKDCASQINRQMGW